MVRCPVCGERGAACGPPTTVIGVDERFQEAGMSSPLREYVVKLAGGIETTVQLSEADAKRLGARLVSTPDTDPPVEAKTRQPPNKAATPANK